jgi:hypothetical protein
MHLRATSIIGGWLVPAAISFAACAAELPDTETASEDVEPAVLSEAISVAAFAVGFQTADNVKRVGLQAGDVQWTNSIAFGPSVSGFACDENCFDPDYGRIYLRSDFAQVNNTDFRICLQGSDGGRGFVEQGRPGCTPWASQGGGEGERATDANGFDPDSYRISIETQPWPSNVPTSVDFRLRGRAFDRKDFNAPWSAFTRWSREGGTSDTGFFCDSNCFDPDGFQVQLEVAVRDTFSFCSQQRPCGQGFGDCDSDFECMPGLRCVSGSGPQFGYGPDVDVCIDAN